MNQKDRFLGKVRIHKPDTCHGWGIEYNYDPSDMDKDASNFVEAAKEFFWSKKKTTPSGEYLFPGTWFYQSGSDSSVGYQFFEYWGAEEEESCHRALELFETKGFQIEE